MIYAELAGGLGNQMFIYAFARALGLRCGEPVTLLDRQDWRDGAPAHTVCALDALNISPDVKIIADAGFAKAHLPRQNAAKALDVTLHVIEAADTAADELLKFQLLMQTADKLDCRFISTGHYARVEQDADECRLCAPEHAECDQTALLEVLPQEILARLILPLGEFDKESVQEIAQDIGCAE